MKVIPVILLLFPLNLWAGAHYYEGGAFFVTGLNKSLLAKADIEASFAVQPPAKWCGVYGAKKGKIIGFKKEVREAAEQFLEPNVGPALAVFYSTGRFKLIEEYPEITNPNEHLIKSPKRIVLGDDASESYEFGVLTAKGFFIYKDGRFAPSYIKNHQGYLNDLLFYIEYLQDASDLFYPKVWQCQLSE